MRFIQVGVGGFGKVWSKALRAEAAAQVVALVDLSEPALADCCREHGWDASICFRSLEEALARAQADALVCVTPPEHHRAVACAAMQAGLDVITEKPMAASPEDCRAMLECALATGRTCAVSQNYRYRPEAWTLAEAVRRGEIGEVGQVWIDFPCGVDFGGGFRHAMDYPVLVDMSIHHFDLLRFVTGLEALSARGEAWNPKWSNYRGDCSSTVTFELAGGARAVYNASWCSKGRYSDWNGNWLVEGSRGAAVYRQGKVTLHRVAELYKETAVEDLAPVEPPARDQAFVLGDFMRAVAELRRPVTDLADNIGSIGMVFAAVEAVRTGKRAEVAGAGLRELAGRLAGRRGAVAGSRV